MPKRAAPSPATITAALAARFDSDAGENLTLRQYLTTLLHTLWVEEESFSGKRPFGNSGWQIDVGYGLVRAGVLPGVIHCDTEDEVDIEFKDSDLNALVVACIDAISAEEPA